MADNEQNKLLGVLTLDYRQVEQAVKKTNELLASLGGNVELNMTEAVEKEFDKLYKRIDRKIKETATKMSGVASSMNNVEKNSKNV